ncbi:MAG TPA: TolC family protein [Chthoniobacterales bacterium]
MKTTTLTLLLLTTLSLHAEQSAEPDSARAALSLAEVTRAVLAANPSIREAQRKWDAAKERVTQEKAWPDLTVRAGSVAARFVNVAPNGFTDQTLTLEQSVPISGKNRSRARIAAADAVVAFEEARRAELDVVAQARSAYFRLADAYAQIELNQRNHTSLAQIAEISRSRYEFGTQNAADTLMAETEAAKLLEVRRDLERNVADAQTQLNVLMNRDAFAAVGRPAELSPPMAHLPVDHLRTLTLQNRPEVRSALARIAGEQARLQLAHRAWIPDPAISAQGQRYNDTGQAVSEVGAGISFSIPWGNYRKYSAGVYEAELSLDSSQAALERSRSEAIGALREALQKAETAHHHLELFRTNLVPQARQTFVASQLAYESGKASFGEWIAAQRAQRDLEAEAREHVADYQIALAELERVVGGDLHLFPIATIPTNK